MATLLVCVRVRLGMMMRVMQHALVPGCGRPDGATHGGFPPADQDYYYYYYHY